MGMVDKEDNISRYCFALQLIEFELIPLRYWEYITIDYYQKLQMHKAVASQHTLFHMVVHVVRLSNSCLEGFLKSFLHFFVMHFK